MSKNDAKGLTGLANLGNTCFLNSCMQIISHTTELNNILEDGEYKKKLAVFRDKKFIVESKMLVEWDNLRKLMWSKNCVVSPGGFLKAVHNAARQKNRDIFTGFSQNDFQEFLLFMVDCFHIGLHREVEMNIKGQIITNKDIIAKKCYTMMKNMYEKEYSEILDLFYGIHVSLLVNKDDKTVSTVPEPFFIIDLPLSDNKSINIIDCFNKYTENEKLEGENGWFNEKTNEKEDVTKKIVFWSLPDVLVISLKRFNYNGRKIKKPVDIEVDNLDLNKYVNGYNNTKYIYELYGTSNHTGGTLGGHYTSTIKVDNNWYIFNDTNVKKIDFDGKNNSQAYCLFYRKKN
jgi:ubiquitin carboxyl-terminal hydrolase 2/21